MHTRTRSTITRRVSGALAFLLALQAGLVPGVARAGGGSGGVTLGSAYLGGNTITEQGGLAVALSATTADNGNVLTVTKNPVGAQSGAGVVVTMGATTTGPALSLAGGTSLFLESTDGSTSAVSGAATGRIRYNNGTGTWQVSTQAGAWASISTGGTTLQAAYNGGNTIAEAGGLAVAISSTTADNANVFTVTKNPAGPQSGAGIFLTMGANTTGRGLEVSMATGSSGPGINVDMNAGSGTSGAGLQIVTSDTSVPPIFISSGGGPSSIGSSAGSSTTLSISNTGTSSGQVLSLTSTVGGSSVLTIVKNPGVANGGSGISLSMGTNTTGDAFTITQAAGFTGSAITVVQGANTVLQLDKFGTLSSPYNGNAGSEHFGLNSSAGGFLATVYGNGANAPTQYSSAFGNGATASGDFSTSFGASAVVQTFAPRSTAIGMNAGCLNSAPDSVALGYLATVNNFAGCIVIGSGGAATAANQLVAGSNTSTISDIYFGKGVTNAAPTVVTIHGTGGTGAGIAGAGLTIAGGISGDAATGGGSVLVKVASAGSGTALTTALTIANTLAATFAGSVAINGSTAASFLDFSNGSTAAVSAAAHARIRYNNGATQLEASINGGAYAAIGGSGGTLQAAYNGGNTITTVGGTPVNVTDSNGDNGDCIDLLKQPGVAHGGHALNISMDSNTLASAILVNSAPLAQGDALDVVNHGTGFGILVQCDNAATSQGVAVTMFTGTNAYGLEAIANAGSAGDAIHGASAGTGHGVSSGSSGGGNAFDAVVSGGGHGLNVSVLSGAGNGVVSAMAAGATGSALVLTGGTQTTNAPLISGTQTWNNAGVTFTAAKINVTSSASAAGSLLLSLQTGGVPMFTVDKAGNTTVAGKLTVTGAIDPPSVSLSSGTALFFDSADGSTAGLSAVGHGRIRYLNGTGWQVSSNGGAYASLSTGGALTFAQVLANGNTAGANDLYMSYQHQMGLGAFSADTNQTYGSGDIATVNVCENANGHRGINIMTSDATRPSIQVYVSSNGRFDGQNVGASTVVDAGGIGLGSRALGVSSGPDAYLTRSATGVLTVGTTLGGTDGTLLATSLGSATTGVGKLYVDYQNNTSATTGNTTINKAAGRFWIAATGTSCTITDSFVTAKSHVFVVPSSDPGVAVAVESVIPSGTGFSVTLTGTITNTTSFDFFVVNAD